MTSKVTLAKWTQSSGPLCLWQCFLSNGQLGAMTSMLWRRFKTIMQLLTNKLSKKYFTDHEILYINDINIFVSKIFTFWTQYSGYSWYFLCSSWNTNMKHKNKKNYFIYYSQWRNGLTHPRKLWPRAEEATKMEGSNFEDSPFHPLLSIIPMQPAASCTCRSGDRNRPMRTLDELARPRPPNPWRGGGRGWGDLL